MIDWSVTMDCDSSLIPDDLQLVLAVCNLMFVWVQIYIGNFGLIAKIRHPNDYGNTNLHEAYPQKTPRRGLLEAM